MNILFVILRWLRMFHEIIFRTILYVDCAYNFPIEITVEPRGVRGQPRGLGRHHIAELAELAELCSSPMFSQCQRLEWTLKRLGKLHQIPPRGSASERHVELAGSVASNATTGGPHATHAAP